LKESKYKYDRQSDTVGRARTTRVGFNSHSGHTEDLKLLPDHFHSRRWWVVARELFMSGAAVGSLPVQHSLRKQ